MQPTPYNNLTAARRREALEREVANSDVDGVDPDHEKIIRQVMLDDWGIRHPREFQIRAVASLAFQRDRLLFLIAKTGSGKSAVPLAVGALQSGITLTMVPLVGLGSDQVSKSTNEANFIEAYHLDNFFVCLPPIPSTGHFVAEVVGHPVVAGSYPVDCRGRGAFCGTRWS